MSDPVQRLDLERGDAYGRAFGDVYDRWYDGVTDAEATARFVARRHRGGLVLELGSGTGRLARPLAERGLTVVGLDASAAMLGRGPNDGRVLPVRADMRALPFGGARGAPFGRGRRPPFGRGRRPPFGTALIAFNTLFNLPSRPDQAALLRSLAGLVDPSGSVIVEVLDLSALAVGPTTTVGLRDPGPDPVVVTATQLDRGEQRLRGQHLEVSDRGVVVRPWSLSWLTPDQLDELAVEAGLVPEARFGTWDGGPPTGTGSVIAVFRPAGRETVVGQGSTIGAAPLG